MKIPIKIAITNQHVVIAFILNTSYNDDIILLMYIMATLISDLSNRFCHFFIIFLNKIAQRGVLCLKKN